RGSAREKSACWVRLVLVGLARVEGGALELLGICVLAEQDFHLMLGILERALAQARQLNAALELAQGLFEREISLFEPFDDLFELGERAFEVARGWIAVRRGLCSH